MWVKWNAHRAKDVDKRLKYAARNRQQGLKLGAQNEHFVQIKQKTNYIVIVANNNISIAHAAPEWKKTKKSFGITT